ncbi:hypothetical protein ACFC84_16485 [Enterococcus casseliflavus]|uniref:hypothetical protein n=1 Tax=Enterococcus casseliflavus TaxID=37734 RepID=UPI001A245D19|nr:hypothetical protein [Enterococcus casseliflavus]MBJ0457584.1 hypothetical protein [Enterococcus faecium]MBZ3642846.1 hypothetical protein [Enterococcus casseliflavus]MDT2974384.1 hypothetical protein [Enterococcus casseliflavus]UBL09874.1 hypothetical protein [Enterococcus casseliflavus]
MRKAKKGVDEIKDIALLEQHYREFEFKRLEKERSKVTKNLAKLILYAKLPRLKRLICLNLKPGQLLVGVIEYASIVLSIKLFNHIQLDGFFGSYINSNDRFNGYIYLLSFVGTVLFALMFMEILIVSFKTGSEKELSELIKTEKDRIKEIDKHKAILIKDSGRSYQSE